jgi:hypothetical protein
MRTLVAGAAFAAALAVAVGAGTGSASGAARGAVACTLLSPVQLQSALGMSQSIVLRNHDGTAPSSEAVNTECGWGVWDGAPPTTTAAMFALARSGHAAQIGIETWAPHTGHEQHWIASTFDKLTSGFDVYSVTAPGLYSSRGLPAQSLSVPGFGHSGTAFVTAAPGLAKGLKFAIGCWWDDKTYEAICVFDEEAAYRRVAADMLRFAKAAVPKFLG